MAHSVIRDIGRARQNLNGARALLAAIIGQAVIDVLGMIKL